MASSYPQASNYSSIGYGLSSALPQLYSPPIVAKRAPTTADKYQIGQLWVYSASNTSYILTSIVSNAAQWQAIGGAGSYTSLTVSGSATIGTGLTVSAGGATITGNSTITGTLGVTGLVTFGTTSALTTGHNAPTLTSSNAGIVASGWLNIKVGATTYYVPYYSNIS